MQEKNMTRSVPAEIIENRILVIRGHKVLLDAHLAELYGVTTAALNQAVSRNRTRFPGDFMFQLTTSELENWRSQTVTSNSAAKMGLRRAPYAFTEQGIAMLSSVLRSKRAIQVNIGIMRAFVAMREAMIAHKELARQLNTMEKKYDAQFKIVFDAIRQLMQPSPLPPKRAIGYIAPKDIP
jgi:hypothetical protein